MRKTLLASASAVALSCTAVSAAQAAPPAPPPIYNWSGFYLGLNAGMGAADTTANFTQNAFASPFSMFSVGVPPNLNTRGFVGGGQAGYNFQTGPYVYGVETDFTWMNLRGTATMSPFFTGKGDNTASWTSNYNWLYTARLRGGITMGGNWLLYGTGGVAVVDVKDTALCMSSGSGCGSSITPSPQNIEWSKSSTLVGGVVGGGIETLFSPNWIFGVKALHVFLPSTTPGLVTHSTSFLGPVPASWSFDHNLTIVTLELTYKFGGP
jgi:outer membrane immunogenic protein